MFNKKELAVLLNKQTAAEQETEQIRKEGEAIRKEVSELSASGHLLKEQAETLSEDKEKLLFGNEDLENEQKKLQQEINKIAHSKKIMERKGRGGRLRNRWNDKKCGAWRLLRPIFLW